VSAGGGRVTPVKTALSDSSMLMPTGANLRE
jgi:hypothetical protein